MPRLVRLGTSKTKDPAIIVEYAGRVWSIKPQHLKNRTETEVQAIVDDRLTTSNADLTVFVHRNRDGSWAIATGKKPRAWAEDIVIRPGEFD